MLARLVRNPLVLGVGAGAVLIIGSTSAVLAQVGPMPGVTPSATATPSTPAPLAITLGRTDNKTGDVSAGTTVPMAAVVTAGESNLTDVRVTFSVDDTAAKVAPKDGTADCTAAGCTFPTLDAGATKTVPLTVDVGLASGTITVTAAASAATVSPVTAPFKLTVSDPDPNGGGTGGGGTGGGGTGGNTGGTKPGGHTGGTNGGTTTGGTSGGGSNTTGGSTGNVPPSGGLNPPSATGVTPPSTAPSPGAVLPSIGAQPPRTAGNRPALTGNSQSMRGNEDPDELTFNKLASTQAAWLAALLVAFSLLLTQVRLGKTANRANRVVDLHRRLRRRVRRPQSD